MSGDYALFVDPDDWLETRAVSVLVSAAQAEGAHIVVSRYIREGMDGGSVVLPEPAANETLTGRQAVHALVCDKTISESAWGKLYSREILASFSFAEGMLCEDVEGVWRLLDAAGRVCCLTDALIHYRMRPDSIMHTISARFLSDYWRAVLSRHEGLAGRSGDYYGATLVACASAGVSVRANLYRLARPERQEVRPLVREIGCFSREHALECFRLPGSSLKLKVAFYCARWDGALSMALFSLMGRARRCFAGFAV